jgi:acyl-CoA dehydrogenase
VELAARVAAECAPRRAEYDRDNRFVAQDYDVLKRSGYSSLAVPEELGGLGANIRQVAYAQAELSKTCGPTGLAIAMHLYSTLAQAFSWRRGSAAAEGVLRRVAHDGLILMTSGGSDGIYPSGVATKVDGGYRFNARKVFCSQSPVADVISTMARYDDPETGPSVLLAGVPLSSPGVEIVETWDTLGMRGTSSHDIMLTDVFVADQQIAARRPWGRNDPALRSALLHFSPTVAAVYWGIAAGARDEALRVVSGRSLPNGEQLSDSPFVQRQIGLLEAKLRTSWWSLLGALTEISDDYTPDERSINLLQIAKRDITTQAIEIVDLALETVGGAAYMKHLPLEQAYRDVRAGTFHPLTPEKTLMHAGRCALGLPVDQIW